MSPLWLVLVAAPAVADTLVRLVLAGAARRYRSAPPDPRPARWLVLVPARGEGELVRPTLESVHTAAGGHRVRTVLLLDGPDPAAAAVAADLATDVIVKEPPGPSKAAALAWAARHLGGALDDVDAVLVLDVGSVLASQFFDAAGWPRGASAMQAFLAGRGAGVGAAVSLSENAGQRREDLGREALGWAVRLRGTGTALAPAVFRELMPRLVTRVEDLEASLLLAADGARVVMGPPGALVADVKPERIRDAAGQRARWLAGRLALPLRQWRALAWLVARRPAEGLAFAVELVSRPLSLTALLRLAIAALLLLADGGRAAAWTAAALATSVGADAWLTGAGRLAWWRAAGRLVVSWVVALALLPRGFFGWIRARR